MNPKPPLWWRFSAILAGMVLLFWLSIEDQSELPALLMSTLVVILVTLRYMIVGMRFRSLSWRAYLLVGMIAGLAVPLIALSLMTLKIGIHGHGVPDYSLQQYINVVYTIPGWIVGGGLIASGAALYQRS